MTADLIYPYRTLVGDGITTTPKGIFEKRPDGSIDAQNIADTLTMTVVCDVDLGDVAGCLSTGEQAESACTIILVAQSITSRRREVISQASTAPRVSFDLDLPRNQHRGLVELTARVVRCVRNPKPDIAKAGEEGEVIGEAAPIRIHFDEPQTAPGASLNVEWRDFGSDPSLSGQVDHLFALEDAEPPTILLNSTIHMLYPILTNNGTRGRHAKIRDAVFMQIAHQVWTSLLGDASSSALKSRGDLVASGRSPDADEVLDDVGGWRAAILRDWACDLTNEDDEDQALEGLVDELAEGLGRLLISAIPAAIQSRLNTMKAYKGLVAEMQLIKE
jgi:hypothetical protein